MLSSLRKTVNISNVVDPSFSDCGNPVIDALARKNAMQTVWHIVNRFPLCDSNFNSIWLARRSGVVGAVVNKFRPDLAALPFGPTTIEGWEDLAMLAVKACGFDVTREELYCRKHLVGGEK